MSEEGTQMAERPSLFVSELPDEVKVRLLLSAASVSNDSVVYPFLFLCHKPASQHGRICIYGRMNSTITTEPKTKAK